jgi:hypothetical protein
MKSIYSQILKRFTLLVNFKDNLHKINIFLPFKKQKVIFLMILQILQLIEIL